VVLILFSRITLRDAVKKHFWKLSLMPLLAATGSPVHGQLPGSDAASPAISRIPGFLADHCTECHDSDVKKGGLDLNRLRPEDPALHPDIWEKVVRRLRTRQMPPAGKPRPDEATYEATVSALASVLDSAAAAQPNPGRTDSVRRLNRTEYQNAIRDLLALDIDAATLLPPAIFPPAFSTATFQPRKRSAGWRWVCRAATLTATPSACDQTTLRRITSKVSR
jgi:hypothetical protein